MSRRPNGDFTSAKETEQADGRGCSQHRLLITGRHRPMGGWLVNLAQDRRLIGRRRLVGGWTAVARSLWGPDAGGGEKIAPAAPGVRALPGRGERWRGTSARLTVPHPPAPAT